jgi:hypothetical protein
MEAEFENIKKINEYKSYFNITDSTFIKEFHITKYNDIDYKIVESCLFKLKIYYNHSFKDVCERLDKLINKHMECEKQRDKFVTNILRLTESSKDEIKYICNKCQYIIDLLEIHEDEFTEEFILTFLDYDDYESIFTESDYFDRFIQYIRDNVVYKYINHGYEIYCLKDYSVVEFLDYFQKKTKIIYFARPDLNPNKPVNLTKVCRP